MCSEGQDFWAGAAVDRSCCGGGDDSVATANRWIHSGSTIGTMKNKNVVILAIVAVLLIVVVAYLWGPSATPPTQKPLLRLSAANFSEFETSFDEAADAPRLLLLLSPT